MAAPPFTRAAAGVSVAVARTPGNSSPTVDSSTPVSPSDGSTSPM